MCLASRVGVSVVVASAVLFSSCAPRIRNIVRAGHPSAQTLLTATKADLIQRVLDSYRSIRSFNAVVDMQASVGSVYQGKFKDYTDLTAFIDFRAPESIRVVALLPVVHTTAFHMVSDGKGFKAYLVVQNRFIQGLNDAPATSANKLENIRPQSFLEAMLVKPVDTVNELTILLDDTTETTASYQLGVIRMPGKELIPHRRITFDRVNLQITEQREYDESGSIVSLTRYDDFKIFDNVRFPAHIEIARPKDGYGIVLRVTKMDINKPIPDAKFVLNRPEGTVLQTIGGPAPVQGHK